MTHPLRTSLLLLTLAGGCSSATSTVGTDSAVATDAARDVAPDRSTAPDVQGTDVPVHADVSTVDVVTVDTPVTTDVGSDAMPSPTCHPTAGTMTTTSECDTVQLAIMQNALGTATVQLSGRLNVALGMTAVCVVVDTIQVVSAATTLATLTGTGVDIPSDGSDYLLAAGPSTTALTAMCMSDANRFDGMGLVINGHMDGGTFTSTCGNNTGDVGWPPRVVVTCHSGLTTPPLVADASQMGSLDQITAFVPSPPTLATVDSTVHINPGVMGFGGPPVMPYDSPMWMGTVNASTIGTGTPATQVTVANFTEGLGSTICPMNCASPPCMGMSAPPVFIARITGTTTTGTYSTELYARECLAEP